MDYRYQPSSTNSSPRYLPMSKPAPRNGPPPPMRGSSRQPYRQQNQSGIQQLPNVNPNDEINIFVESGLPREVDTLQVHSIFKAYGHVTNIRISPNGKAKVTFKSIPNIQIRGNGYWTGLVHKRLRFGREEDVVPPMPVTLHLNLRVSAVYTVPSPRDESKSFPERMSVLASDLTLGFLSKPGTIMPMYTAPKTVVGKPQVLEVKADLKNRTLDFIFDDMISQTNYTQKPYVVNPPAATTYKIRMNFARIQSMVVQELEDGQGARLFTHLDYPPNAYRRVFNEDRTHEENRIYWNDDFTWFRQTEIVVEEQAWERSVTRRPPIALRKPKGLVDVGRWTTYLVDFKDNRKATINRLTEILDALQEFNIQVTKEAIKTESNDSLLDLDAEAPEEASLDSLMFTDAPTILPFEVQYQLDACISQNYLNDSNIDRPFMARLSELKPEMAISLLEDVEERKARVFEPLKIFEVANRIPKKILKIPSYCVKMRRVTVTPTTMYISSPSVELSNRVLREYSQHLDRFLRVQFMDEKFEGKLYVTDKVSAEQLLKRVANTLRDGIRIGYRHYKFLAFGNSQFRENGAYFFAPTDQVTCESIREWMGEFTHIRVIAKYCARLGQCFSTTRAIGSVKTDTVTIPDIERNGYCFSDGVGLMSPFLSEMIAHELNIYKSGVPSPSAYQFRLGGCKGVLAVSQRMKGRNQLKAMIRPSQKKFDASALGLEINRVAVFCSASLNRQLILILSALGVPDFIFMSKLKQMLANLEKAMVDDQMALSQLCRSVDHNRTSLYLAGLVRAGFMKCKEPFIMSALHLWRAWSIKYLKEKARIIVENGAFLLGVVDDSGKSDEEDGVLRGHYDADDNQGPDETDMKFPEVFCQISDPNDPSKLRIIEGRCIVARNPSLHPGDIRVVNAVNKPELHHHVNVIVFSRNGDRDLPSMCSGGDLDGDDFIIIWDPDYMPNIINYPAMDYTAPAPLVKDGDVTAEDMMDFFLNYMKNDRLGTIANCHLVWADKQGADCYECKELAQLHSKAVDFNKTGEPAELPKRLRVRSFPHFMEKKASKSYKSHNILGQLYDQVNRVQFSPMLDSRFDERILSTFTLDELEPWMQLAGETKVAYDTAIKRVMVQHEINSEIEVVTGFVLAHSAEKNDYKYHEEIGTLFQGIKDTIRNTAQKEIDKKHPGERGAALFVAAAYYTTSQEVEKWRELEGVPPPSGPKSTSEANSPKVSPDQLDEKITEDLESIKLETSSIASSQDSQQTDIKDDVRSVASGASSKTSRTSLSQSSQSRRQLSDSHTRISASKCPFISFPWILSDFLIRIAQGEFQAKDGKMRST